MAMLTITLPDDLSKIAWEKDLFSPLAIETYVRGQLMKNSEETEYPPGFDPRLRGAASPELMGTVKYHGDIVAPINIKWETVQ